MALFMSYFLNVTGFMLLDLLKFLLLLFTDSINSDPGITLTVLLNV